MSMRLKEVALMLFLTVIYFCIAVGTKVLDPFNIAWLETGDSAQHFLGWLFFSQSNWTMPLGMNPSFGLDASSSIVYSDSIPILAIIYKFIGIKSIQYFGLWIFICLLFQCLSGYILIGSICPNSSFVCKTFGAVFFMLSPIMFFRFGLHNALAAHFVILMALYLNFSEGRFKQIKWNFLVILSIGIHFYLFVMTVSLWLADLFDENGRKNHTPVLKKIASVLILVISSASALWIFGYFVNGSGYSDIGYGLFRSTLTAFFDSRGSSLIIPKLSESEVVFENGPFKLSDGTYEGFGYFGIGVLLLILIAACYTYKNFNRKYLQSHLWLVIICCAMYLFALSNNLTLGRINWHFNLPLEILKYAGILRASGRFIWPLYYLILAVSISIVIKCASRKSLITILSICIILQIIDIAPGIYRKKMELNQVHGNVFETPFKSDLWEILAKKYKRLVWVNEKNSWSSIGILDWRSVAYFAGTHDLATNAALLARPKKLEESLSRVRYINSVQSGIYDENTLYILDPDYMRASMIAKRKDEDLFTTIDGLYVVAPGWKKCADCKQIKEVVRQEFTEFKNNEPIYFNRNGNGVVSLIDVGKQDQYGVGWSYPEDWGVWSNGNASKLYLLMPKPSPAAFEISVVPFLGGSHNEQNIELWVNGSFYGLLVFSDAKERKITIPIGVNMESDKFLILEFKHLNVKSPKSLGLGDDDRRLSLGIIKGKFVR